MSDWYQAADQAADFSTAFAGEAAAALAGQASDALTSDTLTSALAVGFPSPAEDFPQLPLDLNRYLIRRPEATYFFRVGDEAACGMAGAQLASGDLLVVDRSLPPRTGQLVVAVVDEVFCVRRLFQQNGRPVLQTEPVERNSSRLLSPERPRVCAEETLQLWGVVIGVVRRF